MSKQLQVTSHVKGVFFKTLTRSGQPLVVTALPWLISCRCTVSFKRLRRSLFCSVSLNVFLKATSILIRALPRKWSSFVWILVPLIVWQANFCQEGITQVCSAGIGTVKFVLHSFRLSCPEIMMSRYFKMSFVNKFSCRCLPSEVFK